MYVCKIQRHTGYIVNEGDFLKKKLKKNSIKSFFCQELIRNRKKSFKYTFLQAGYSHFHRLVYGKK